MYGKIVSKEEADKLFGPVLESKEISVSDLLALVQQTKNSVMFGIINSELHILGDGRKVLHPAGKPVKPEVVFYHYSKEVVLELLNASSNGIAAVEARQDKLTVTCGASTLEWSTFCPPYCL